MVDPAFDIGVSHPFNADRMRQIMQQRHLTLEEVAEAANVAPTTLKKWGKRTQFVSGEAISLIATKLIIPPWELVTNERVDHKRYINRVTQPEVAAELSRLFDIGAPPKFDQLAAMTTYGKVTESAKRDMDIIEFAFVTAAAFATVEKVLVIDRATGLNRHLVTTGASILQSYSPAVLPHDWNELQEDFRREVALPTTVSGNRVMISHLGWVRNRVKDRQYYFWIFKATVIYPKGVPTLPVDPGDSVGWEVLTPSLVNELRSKDGTVNRADRVTCDMLNLPGLPAFADKEVIGIVGSSERTFSFLG